MTPPLRHLWQVPTLLLGLISFAAVCLAHPPWKMAGRSGPDPALAELRELLKQRDFDADRALKLGAEAVHGARAPRAVAEAHFLLGSLYVALAERAGPGQGRDQWREARAHLEQARALGVAEDDGPRLDYRLAKAWAQTGEAPARVVAALDRSIEAGADDDVDAAAGYGLLAEAYLRLPRPDVERALEATVKQIDKSIVEDRLLGPARLRRGELLLRLDRREEALDALTNVGAKAPPEVTARARRLSVGILEQEGRWDEAAALWRAIHDDGPAPQDGDAVMYHLGLCLRNSGHPDQALPAWDECLRHDGPGDEGPAAALGVGELRLRGGQFDLALAALGRAVRDVKEPGAWHNGLVPLAQARAVFEAGCRSVSAAGASEAAVRLARLYERLAPPGRAQELRAEAADAGARAAQEKAQRATGDEARRLYHDAEELLRQAGEAYEQAADAQPDDAEQAERLWSAALHYQEAHEAKRAAAAFERFLMIAEPAGSAPVRRFGPRLNEAWYRLAVARRDANLPGVGDAFSAAARRLEWGSRYLYRARYELAVIHKEPDGAGGWRWTDQAEGELETNLTQLRAAGPDRDDEAREKTLYALGDLYFQRRGRRDSLSRAIDILEEALRAFPNNPLALTARYQLAESYRMRADQRSSSFSQEQPTTEARLAIEKKVMEDRERAIANYQELSRALEAKPDRDEHEERILTYALRLAAEVRFWAGGYEKSGEMYDALAERIKDKKGFEFEYLSALGNGMRAYREAARAYPSTEPDYQGKVQAARLKADRALREIRAGLGRLDPESRKAFEKWLELFAQPVSGEGGAR